MKNYDELIERLEKEFRITEIGLIGDSLNAIKELIEQRDLAMADARYFEKQRNKVTKQRDELLAELLRVKEICLRECGIGIVNEAVIANVKESK